MFNYKSKLGSSQLDKNITTHQLIKLIKDNPQKELISQIRNKRSSDDKLYKALKEKLPVFAPNALFNNNLNQSNFISGTGYFYLDIDDCENYGSAYELKESFLQKHSDKVYLCWTSVSLGGIGILLKLDDVLSQVNDFNCLYYYLTKELFSDFNFDDRAKNSNRVNIISHDENLFINNNSLIEISNVDLSIYSEITDDKKVQFNSNLSTNSNYSGTAPFQKLNTNLKILLHTNLDWEKDEFVKFQTVEDYFDCRIYGKIQDGKKRNVFTHLIPKLYALNGIEKESEILSHVKYINDWHTTEPIPENELIKLFNSVTKDYKEGKLKAIGKRKSIHLNPSIKHCKSAKHSVRNKLSGYSKRLRTQARIEDAKEKLVGEGKKVTQKNVSSITRIGIRTVKSYWNLESLDMDYLDELISFTNSDYLNNKQKYYDIGFIGKEVESVITEFNYIVDEETGEVIDNEVLDTQIQGETISEYKRQGEENGADNGARNTNPRTPLQHLKIGKVDAA